MGRKKIDNSKKNISVSISLLPRQVLFLKEHEKFNFSKYVQLLLDEYINLVHDVERIQTEYNIDKKEVIL